MEASIYRVRNSDLLVLCVGALLALGVLMVESASTTLNRAAAAGDGHEPARWSWSPRGASHMKFAGWALVTFLVVGHLDYRWLGRKSKSIWRSPVLWLTVLAAATCVVVLVPGVGKSVNGARRWLPLGSLQVQPSELAKWAVVLFLAWWLSNRPVDLDRFFKGFVPTMAPIGLLCLLVVIQDFGTAALIGVCAMTMLLVGRVKMRHLVIVLPLLMAAGTWFVAHEKYRRTRLLAFLNPYADPQGEGYHMIQSLLSFSTGGLFGRGLGNGIQKLGYLPEDTTDFIFAVICEELGLFGALLTVALYAGVLYVAWQAIREKRDDFGRLLAFGIASMLGLQATINIAVATVSVPTKGLSLPLVSAGGSGLIITCAALGLLYSVSRSKVRGDELLPAEDESASDAFDETPAALTIPRASGPAGKRAESRPRRPRRLRTVNESTWSKFTTTA